MMGIITEITWRLQGVTVAIAAAVCAFPSTADAVDTAIHVIQMGIPVARIEYGDPNVMRAVNAHSRTALTEQPMLWMALQDTEASVADHAETVAMLAHDSGGSDFQWPTHAGERAPEGRTTKQPMT